MEDQNNFDNFLNKYKLPVAMGLVGLVLLAGGVISSGILPKTFLKASKVPPESKKDLLVKVDVSGAVLNPGVYILSSGSRIEDALKAAGGVTESADPAFLSKTLNLAQTVSDGMKIYVPKMEEAGKMESANVAGASQVGLVNINTASASDLDKLPGVGPVSAQNIIDKRPYGSLEELLTKKAVQRSVYEKIKGMVSVY